MACVQEQLSSFAPRLSDDAPEYMAAVLQVVAAQVLERAGDAALERHSGRIAPREIREAVRRDGELTQLVGDEALAEGGLLGSQPLGVDSDTLRAAAEGEAALDSAAVSDAAAGLAAPPPPPPAEAAFDAALPLSCVQEQLSSFAPRLSDDAPEYMAAVSKSSRAVLGCAWTLRSRAEWSHRAITSVDGAATESSRCGRRGDAEGMLVRVRRVRSTARW